MIGIVDYGAGNLRSVQKAFDFLGIDSIFITNKRQIETVQKLVLPGVGAFGFAMERLKELNLLDDLKKWMLEGLPLLGICLGMQLLLETSDESTDVSGLSVIKGYCKKFQKLKVPQVGWNNVEVQKECVLFNDIKQNSLFYFVHSYYPVIKNNENGIAFTKYETLFPSVLNYKNTYGVQFHPEKSGEIGLKLLDNWVKLC